jgi:hypothetical protein
MFSCILKRVVDILKQAAAFTAQHAELVLNLVVDMLYLVVDMLKQAAACTGQHAKPNLNSVVDMFKYTGTGTALRCT